jgi:hypothetical protein
LNLICEKAGLLRKNKECGKIMDGEFDVNCHLLQEDKVFYNNFGELNENKNESLFVKNFFAEYNINNSNNPDFIENKISPNLNKATDRLLNDKYIFPLLKLTDCADDIVSPFVPIHNPNNKKTFNNKDNNPCSINQIHYVIKNPNNWNSFNPASENNFELKKIKNANNNYLKYSTYSSKITPSVIHDIVKYLVPKEEVFIEDNSTIYGTYVRIKPYTIDNLINNIYIIYSCLNVYNSVNNFNFENALHVLLNNEKELKNFGAELFNNFLAESNTNDKDPKKPNGIGNAEQMDLAIKLNKKGNRILIKECNAENYLFYNVEYSHLLENIRRKYLFEKREDEYFNKNSYFVNNNNYNNNNNFKNSLNIEPNSYKNNAAGILNNRNIYCNNKYIFLNQEKIMPNNYKNGYTNNWINNNTINNNIIYNSDHNKSSSSVLNNNRSKENCYFEEEKIREDNIESFYSRQNTDVALEYLKEKLKNLNLKKPKAQIYSSELNFEKLLEHAVINSNKDKESKSQASELSYFYNNFDENAAKQNCLVSAYMQNIRKKADRLINKSLEMELNLLFLNKKKIDFLLKNFPNETYNPYNPNSTILNKLFSSNYSIAANAHGLGNYPYLYGNNNINSFSADNEKNHKKAFNASDSDNNPNSNTNQKQAIQNTLFSSSNNSHVISFNNYISLSKNNANYATKSIEQINKMASSHNNKSACSAEIAFNTSNYPSSDFLELYSNSFSKETFTRFFKENLAFLKSHMDSSTNSKLKNSNSHVDFFKQNNFIVKNECVFLNSAKSGFIVSKIGSFEEILKAIKFEFQEFFNADTQSGKIEFISFDKFFEFQKLDLNSREFKGEIDKNWLFNSQGIFHKNFLSLENFDNFFKNPKDFSCLYLIETSGDPCGIMNRLKEIVFVVSKTKKIENQKLFAFNNRVGFLLGNEISCSVFHRDSEAQAFLAYDAMFDVWTVSDLTCFLKPSVCYGKDYHGLWICVSPDKRSVNRFSPIMYAIKSGDEIKISETVMSVNFEYRC